MNKTLVSLLFFVASATAKGRSGGGRGGGGSIGGIVDDWDAPAETKAAMAFEIVWFIFSLIQLSYILKNLKGIPSMAARGPYIMLAFITLCLGLSYLFQAILTRLGGVADFEGGMALNAAMAVFGNFDVAFRPAIVLYLIHVRGDVLRAVKGNTTTPLSTQTWKRILDWVLASLAFIMFTAATGVTATELTEIDNRIYDYNQVEQLYHISVDLTHTGVALVVFLTIILVVSVIVQFIQGKGTLTSDLVTRHLLIMAVPLFVLYATDLLFFEIFPLASPSDYDVLALNLASVIVAGVIEIFITAVLIFTMTLPGVQWTPQTVAPGTAGIPGTQWGNVGWSQPGYNPQQPPFYPQPNPMFQQMQQQQQYPYSPPTHSVPNQAA